MTRIPNAPLKLRHQSGVGLIELMISMLIGVFLLGAVVLVYVSTSTSSKSGTLESQMNEDASIALDMLKRQIRLAGFSTLDATGVRQFSDTAVFGCKTDFSSNTAAFGSLACGTGTNDALAVRYIATTLTTQPIDVSGTDQPTNCAYEAVSAWNHDGVAATAAIALADDRYYIANDTDGTPSLFCQGRTGTGFGTATALIPNIESMQVDYGITLTPAAGDTPPHQLTGYVAADDSTLTGTGWQRVAVVNICLVARSSQVVPADSVTRAISGRYRDCDGAVQTPTDGFLRRAYQTTVQLRNLRPAVPQTYSAGQNPWRDLVTN